MGKRHAAAANAVEAAANLGRGKSKRTWPLAELPLSVVFHLWLEAAVAAAAGLSGGGGSLACCFEEETVEPAWIFAEDVEAAWLAWCGGGVAFKAWPSKLPPIFKRRSESKGERNGGGRAAGNDGEMNRSPS